MFTGSLRESQQEEITLVEVHGEPLQLLVQYCYTGTIEIREDNVETLLATACLLQLNAVVTACCNFLARQLHPSNCLQVCKNQEFYQLSSDQLANLLKSDDLNVTSEEDVFNALMSWIQHDAATREKSIPDLLALIRLPLLPPGVCIKK